jgi:5-oxoprolinase (ATP-hydrolysing) subunit B
VSLRLLPYGDRALLAEVDAPTVLALAAAIGQLPGVEEVVPAARSLLVCFDPLITTSQTLRRALEAGTDAAPATEPGDPIELLVRYDGADLHAVADEVQLSVDAVIARHAAGDYTVAFCGFAPGFAYLSGLDPALHVPRLTEPRTAVPPGSVGIGGAFTGVYPRSSPGGWRLLGRTDAPLWDPGRTPPALLTPGRPVRFRCA